MAGPTLQLRAKIFGKVERQKINVLLKRIANIDVNEENKFEFHFKKGKTLNLFLKDTSCLFMMDFSSKTDEYDELQLPDILEKLNDKPEMFINICAMCNDKTDHQLLANFGLELNKIVGGFIDLNGAIIPDLEKDKSGNFIMQTHKDYQNFVNATNGQIHEIKYMIDDNRTSYNHIVDATWLHNWLLNTSFKLIK